jgi:serine/threonine-protein kinase
MAAALALLALGAGGIYYWQHKQKLANAGTMQAPSNRGTLSVTSDPPGASIWIDGEMRTEVTPATIAKLPTGRAIDVKLTKEGFEIARQAVTLAEGDAASTMLSLTLTKGSVTVDVNVTPPGLSLTLLLDGQTAKTSPDSASPDPGPPHSPRPARIEGVSAGDTHKLVVSAPGYVDQTVQFTGEPQERKRLDIVMQKDMRRRR